MKIAAVVAGTLLAVTPTASQPAAGQPELAPRCARPEAAASAAAQDPRPDPALVARTAERLADPRAPLADAAMVGLIRGGAQSVPLLRAVLAQARDRRARERAERALSICAVDAPVLRGLKVGLAADRTALAPGEAVALTVTLCNVGDAPIALYVGMSYSGSVLENGLALCRLAGGAGDADEQARLGRVGFCGTGAQPLVVVLPPWSSRQFTTRATLRSAPEPAQGMIDHDGPHLGMECGFVYLPVPARAASLRLQVRHAVDPGAMAPPEAKPDWHGTMVSNELVLAVNVR